MEIARHSPLFPVAPGLGQREMWAWGCPGILGGGSGAGLCRMSRSWQGGWGPAPAGRPQATILASSLVLARPLGGQIVVFWSLSRVRLFGDPMDCSPPGSSVHGISHAKIRELVAISFLLQEIFPTQGPNPGLPLCWQILYH